MKTKIKNAKNTVVDHVSRNRMQYSFVAGFSAATYLFYKMDRVKAWNQFLALEGLTDKFYNPEEWLEDLNPTF